MHRKTRNLVYLFGAQGRRAKNVFYEEAVRVPLLVRAPMVRRNAAVSDVCINTPDIMPTLLSVLGLPVPDDVEGMDLSHCLGDGPGEVPEEALLQGMGPTAVFGDGFEWRGVRTARHTYAVMRRDRSEFLFDHVADPHQLENLAGDRLHAELRKRLRDRLAHRLHALGDTFEASTWYEQHWTRDRVILRTATAPS